MSFGLPVRNGETSLRRCVDSILAQDFEDFELVISDNASTDGTARILEEYAARDPRVRVSRNPEDIGIIENVNLVFRQSRGEYFRWIGADDWLEPAYASRCVAALEGDPGAILVTTYFRVHGGDGTSRYEEYQGEKLDSEEPERRLARMLWFLHAGDTKYDPIYSMIRRDVLGRTALIRMMNWADWMLAAELSLIGRFQHVPECLAHRTKAYKEHYADREKVFRRYHPSRYNELYVSPWGVYRVLLSIIGAAPLAPAQRVRCWLAATRFLFKETRHRYTKAFRRTRRRNLGFTRRNLWAMLRRSDR